MDVMAYKGYTGSIEFSAEDNVYFGKIIGIRSLISYEGETAKELLEDFHRSVSNSFCRPPNTGLIALRFRLKLVTFLLDPL